MDRKELEGYILDTYGIEPDYPWKDQPDYAVFRHPANCKWFALTMRIPVDRIGRKGSDLIDVVRQSLSAPCSQVQAYTRPII